jgi:hypothetical protein
MALTISQLVNDYGSYSGKTLVGDRGSRANVPGSGFGGVTGVPYDNITFIVKVNGTRYASSKWLSQQQNGNPYIHSFSVARIDLQDIPNAPIDSITDILGVPKNMTGKDGDRQPLTLKLGEKFAEVEATSNLTADDAILSFINDLLSESPDVKPWQNYGSFVPMPNPSVPVSGAIKNPLGIPFPVGVITPFGGNYNPELDMKGEYPGMEFQAKTGVNLLGVEGDAAFEISIPKTTEVVDVKEEPIKIEPIDLSSLIIPPLDLGDFDFNFDFGLGNINTDFFNIDLNSNNFNPISNGGDSFDALSNEGGLASVGLGSYNTDYGGQPLGAIYDDSSTNINTLYDRDRLFGSLGY